LVLVFLTSRHLSSPLFIRTVLVSCWFWLTASRCGVSTFRRSPCRPWGRSRKQSTWWAEN